MSCVREAADVFQAHREELGFVNEAQCREKDLYTVERDGAVIGAALANHCVRKPQTTLYELAVLPEWRREGIATELINQLTRDSPHNKVVAKCPTDLPANDFYESNGWECVDQEDGKNRALNVWERRVDSIDLITTGRPDLTDDRVISEADALRELTDGYKELCQIGLVVEDGDGGPPKMHCLRVVGIDE